MIGPGLTVPSVHAEHADWSLIPTRFSLATEIWLGNLRLYKAAVLACSPFFQSTPQRADMSLRLYLPTSSQLYNVLTDPPDSWRDGVTSASNSYSLRPESLGCDSKRTSFALKQYLVLFQSLVHFRLSDTLDWKFHCSLLIICLYRLARWLVLLDQQLSASKSSHSLGGSRQQNDGAG